MHIKDVKNKLLEGIFSNISKYGFKFNKREKHFEREQNDFIQILDVLFFKRAEGIFVEPVLKIKSKEIEGLYHSVSKKEPQYNSGTITLGNNLFKIIDFIDKNIEEDLDTKQSYLIEEEKDIDILINVISKRFEEYALPYFNQNSAVSSVDELLNKYPRNISVHNWLYPLRACIAIIAAKLNKNPKFEELLYIYEEELKEAVEPYKTEFTELKEMLQEDFIIQRER